MVQARYTVGVIIIEVIARNNFFSISFCNVVHISGQLGGLEGGRIKAPTPCESLSLLRPIQLCGGEQTLFAVTPDGRLFATGLFHVS